MSMSLARRIPNLRNSLIRRGIRLFTTKAPSLPARPYLLLPMDVVGDYPGGKVANFNFYDLETKKRVTVAEQRIPESIHLSRSIGSSRGWVVRMNNEDLTVHLTNMFNPSAPKSSYKVISLPPLLPLPHSLDPSESTPLTDLVRYVSLSSSPDQEDCTVAIKFWGSCISLCRLSDDSSWSWTHINYLPSDYDCSSLIYSNAASIFYLTSLSGNPDPNRLILELCKREFSRHKDKNGFPLVACFLQRGRYERPEKLSDSEHKLLRGCHGENRYLVETPSGDIFTILRYMVTGKKYIVFCDNESDVYVVETRRFELYKHDVTKGAETYVGDIGDLCIFSGKNEAFCVSASIYPGLKPNSIYFTEKNQICAYDIATHTIHESPHQEHLLTPFWLSPILH